ncbi:class I SAM-dependent methyltransferase [Anabaena azotica]|uniref:Class I SAM-dependent methyltransferase n=1 Tax=Anabaena azotica FACHB-119 TaxID=947527 RepID=A0ABR8D4W8_9NOST|nr:class I SAM-dependent methyltransferase [Anabaena azotica]MBD2500798.1 class I SAM-dependent methyltransferase [Anabaena azotica FACHB-119]
MLRTELTLSEKRNTGGYIHSFSETEQNRLMTQSRFLEPYIYDHIDFSTCSHILEVGCGVGAQMEVLLSRYPNLKITGIDISERQIKRACEFLKPHIDSDRVSLHIGEGRELPFANDTFNGAVIFFVLEHTPDPVAILKEIKRVMQLGSHLYCTEVFNTSLYIYPFCPSVESYWRIFNHYQTELKGEPNVGIKLCNLALKAGFCEPKLRYVPVHLDARIQDTKERELFVDYWTGLFMSAAPALLSEKRITTHLLEAVKQELNSIKHNPDSVFAYTAMQLEVLK